MDLDCDVDVSVTCFLPIGAHSSYSTTLRLFSLHRSKVSLFGLSSGIILLAHWSLSLLIPLLLLLLWSPLHPLCYALDMESC